jgi:hypothetical protein
MKVDVRRRPDPYSTGTDSLRNEEPRALYLLSLLPMVVVVMMIVDEDDGRRRYRKLVDDSM